MIRHIFLSCAALLLCLSCHKETLTGSGGEGIEFTAEVCSVSSRASSYGSTSVTNGDFTSHLLDAYYSDGTDARAVGDDVYISKETIKKYGDALWQAESTYYWPSEGSLWFFAYNTDTNISSYSQEDKTFVYSTPTEVLEQNDLLVDMVDRTATNAAQTAVSFEFNHALCRVDFNVTFADAAYPYYRLTVGYTGVDKTATYDFFNGVWLANGRVEFASTDATVIDYLNVGVTSDSDKIERGVNDYLFLVPHEEGESGSLSIKVEYYIQLGTSSEGSEPVLSELKTVEGVIPIASTSNLTSGVAYTYNIKVTNGELQYLGQWINGWDTEFDTSGNIDMNLLVWTSTSEDHSTGIMPYAIATNRVSELASQGVFDYVAYGPMGLYNGDSYEGGKFGFDSDTNPFVQGLVGYPENQLITLDMRMVTDWMKFGDIHDDTATASSGNVLDDNDFAIPPNTFNKVTRLRELKLPSGVAAIGDWAFQYCTGLEEITIADVRHIEPLAFTHCTNLETVIGGKLERVHEYAFDSCEKLTNIDLDLLEMVDAYSFAHCSSLGLIDIPNVTSVEHHAFNGCKAMTLATHITRTTVDDDTFDVAVLPNLDFIGDYSFQDCNSLTNGLELRQVSSIGSHAFFGTGFKYMSFASAPPTDGSDDGISGESFGGFDKSVDCALAVHTSRDKEVYSYNNVTYWKGRAWKGNITFVDSDGDPVEHSMSTSNLLIDLSEPTAGADIPTTISTYLAQVDSDDLFDGDVRMITVGIPSSTVFDVVDGSDVNQIIEAVDDYMDTYPDKNYPVYLDMTATQFPFDETDNTRITFTNNAFQGFTRLRRVLIPSDVNVMGVSAFEGCTNLEKIMGADVVTYIGNDAFENCTSLPSVSFSEVQEVGYDVFKGCSVLSSVDIPELINVGVGMFWNCVALPSVTFDEAFTIGDNAFNGCSQLSSVTASKLTDIGASAFAQCWNLTNVDNLTLLYEVGAEAFAGSGLTSIYIDKLEVIGDGAFQYCQSLETVNLPSLHSISANAFSGCTALSSVAFYGGVVGNYAFSGCTGLEQLTLSCASQIGEGAFKGASKLASLSLPTTTIIYGNAFEGCDALDELELSAAGIDTNISTSTFTGLTTDAVNLTLNDDQKTTVINEVEWKDLFWESITFSDGTVPAETNIFTMTANSTYLSTEKRLDMILGRVSSGNCEVEFDGVFNGGCFYRYYTDDEGVGQEYSVIKQFCDANYPDLTVSLDLSDVTGLDGTSGVLSYGAFKDFTSLTSITMPLSYTSLSTVQLFDGCTSLTYVAGLDNVTNLDAYGVFLNCKSLTSLSLPSLVSLTGSDVFAGSGITHLELTNASLVISPDAFFNFYTEGCDLVLSSSTTLIVSVANGTLTLYSGNDAHTFFFNSITLQ